MLLASPISDDTLRVIGSNEFSLDSPTIVRYQVETIDPNCFKNGMKLLKCPLVGGITWSLFGLAVSL
jgi:hypothetical protein